MDLRQLTPDIAVSGQISLADVEAAALAGFKTLINNRPDSEITPDLGSEAMAAAAKKAGIEYRYLPFVPGQVTPELITGFSEALSLPGPHFAYCRSGNRSTVLWALSQAGKRPEGEILETAAQAGYDISGVRPLIASLANSLG